MTYELKNDFKPISIYSLSKKATCVYLWSKLNIPIWVLIRFIAFVFTQPITWISYNLKGNAMFILHSYYPVVTQFVLK
jgi:hypothetical protein